MCGCTKIQFMLLRFSLVHWACHSGGAAPGGQAAIHPRGKYHLPNSLSNSFYSFRLLPWQASSDDGVPALREAFADEQELQDFLSLLMRHWNSIGRKLEEDAVFTPLLFEDEEGTVYGNDWARGFMRGVSSFVIDAETPRAYESQNMELPWAAKASAIGRN
jgi:hypothetical protein